MMADLPALALVTGVLAAAPALVLVALERPTRGVVRQAVLCEAVGGPCDGRTWYLPELAPIWLHYDGSRHLYRPVGPGVHGAGYGYAGVSETAAAEQSPTWRAASRSS